MISSQIANRARNLKTPTPPPTAPEPFFNRREPDLTVRVPWRALPRAGRGATGVFAGVSERRQGRPRQRHRHHSGQLHHRDRAAGLPRHPPPLRAPAARRSRRLPGPRRRAGHRRRLSPDPRRGRATAPAHGLHGGDLRNRARRGPHRPALPHHPRATLAHRRGASVATHPQPPPAPRGRARAQLADPALAARLLGCDETALLAGSSPAPRLSRVRISETGRGLVDGGLWEVLHLPALVEDPVRGQCRRSAFQAGDGGGRVVPEQHVEPVGRVGE